MSLSAPHASSRCCGAPRAPGLADKYTITKKAFFDAYASGALDFIKHTAESHPPVHVHNSMQITRVMAAVLMDMDFEAQSGGQRDGTEQPAFASLPDTTPVSKIFTAAHSCAEAPWVQAKALRKKLGIHHSVFRFSCTTPGGQTYDYYMDFSALQSHEAHYQDTEAGRARWARMLDALPASKVATLPDGRRAIVGSTTDDAVPLITASSDVAMKNYTYSNGGRRGSTRIPDNTPCVAATSATVGDLKAFAVDYLCAHGTYRLFKGKAGPRNVCGDFPVAAYARFAGIDGKVKPFLSSRSYAWHIANTPVFLAQAYMGMNTDWFLRVQTARRPESILRRDRERRANAESSA